MQLFEEQDERSAIRLVSITTAEEIEKVANFERRVQPEVAYFFMIVARFVVQVVMYVVDNVSLEPLENRRPRFYFFRVVFLDRRGYFRNVISARLQERVFTRESIA
jgi:hypothetical protein